MQNKKKFFLFVLFFTFFLFYNFLIYCQDTCPPQSPENNKNNMGNPGGDVPDDNYSFSSGVMQVYKLAPEAVIFTNGYWQEALKLYGGLHFDGQDTAQKLFDSSPFLVIPSGGLFGKVITIAVSLEKASNQELARRLLLTAVALLNRPEIFAISDLSRVVPIQFTLKNSLGDEKSFVIKEIIPQGVEGYGYDPKPDAGEELKWTLSIPSGNEKGAFYWAKLPNQIGTFDLKSEIYEASVGANHDSPIDQVSLQFEVTSTIVARIDEIVAELEQLAAAGEDQGRIHQAVSRLESVRNRTGDDILSLYLDVVDCAMAGKALREVQAVDVSSLRVKVVDVLMSYARRFYDKAITIPPIELSAFSTRLQQ